MSYSARAFAQTPAVFMYNLIYRSILDPEMKRLYKRLDELATMNVARGANTKVMAIKGDVLVPDGKIYLGIKASPVHPDLVEEVDEVRIQLKEFAAQRTYIKNCCSFLISVDANYQEIRDSLSDMICSYIPDLRNFSRTRPEMYYILHKPSLVRQWTKAKEHIEFYIGNLLVYG